MPSSIIELGSALLNIKDEAEYLKLKEIHSSFLFNNAWDSLTDESQAQVNEIIKNNPIPSVESVIKELIDCVTLAQLKEVKSSHPISLIGDAWDLILSDYPQEADRIKQLSIPEQQSKVANVSNSVSIPNEKLSKEINDIKREMNLLLTSFNRLNDRINRLSNQV